jgi:hypothetical protein
VTAPSGAFIDLGPGEQSALTGQGQPPSPAQPMSDGQLAAWQAEFPEAREALALVAAQKPASPTPPPAPTATLPPTPTPAPQSACDHPFFPLRLGATWIYTATAPVGEGSPGELRTITITDTVTAVEGDLQSATAAVGQTLAYGCSSDGLVLLRAAIPFGAVTSLAGVYLPPADQLTRGSSWTYNFTVDPGILRVLSVQMTQTVTATDPVTIDGQLHAGLQISVVEAQDDSERAYTRVLARGVGLVEESYRQRRLVSFSFP